jgi:hypothetical protein
MHGIAVLSVREGLEFGTELRSDKALLAGLVQAMLAAVPERALVHALRDPTRGGVAETVCEIAGVAAVGIELDERRSRCARRCTRRALIGSVCAEHPGVVTVRTPLGVPARRRLPARRAAPPYLLTTT